MRKWYEDNGHRDATYVLMPGQSGPGQTQQQCMTKLGYQSQQQAADKFAAEQKLCLYNVQAVPGYLDLYDPSVHMPFNWQWVSSTQWKEPPAGWQIPQRSADTGRRVRLRNANGNNLGAPDGLAKDNWVWVKPGIAPLDLIAVDNGTPPTGQYYRVSQAPYLFLSYRASSGAVKLYDSPNQADFLPAAQSNGTYGFKSLYWNQWMWLSGESPYISRTGNPANANAQWYLDPY